MNGMSTVEKSMEKTKFYNREDLKAKDVVRLIGRGMSVCKKLAQRSKNVNSAVKLYNDIMNELHEGVRI